MSSSAIAILFSVVDFQIEIIFLTRTLPLKKSKKIKVDKDAYLGFMNKQQIRWQ
jgi:hypothetical protein